MNRRDVLCSTLALIALPALAHRASITALTDYERDSGGHIGVYAKNLRTGAEVSWRAHERFVMCSSFKASLAACVLANVDRGQARAAALGLVRPEGNAGHQARTGHGSISGRRRSETSY